MTFVRPSAADRESFRDSITGLTLENRAFYLTFLDDYSTIIVSDIRTYFQNNPRTSSYRWTGVSRAGDQIETADDSKIHIATESPDNQKRWPSVLLSDVSGSLQDLWLGQKMGTLVGTNPNYDPTAKETAESNGEDYLEEPLLELGERYGGKLQFTVTIAVRALSLPEVNRVTDLLLHGLVGPLRREWHSKTLNWIPNSTNVSQLQKETLSDSNRQTVYKRLVTFALQGEWYDDFFYQTVTVDDIIIDSVTLEGPPSL